MLCKCGQPLEHRVFHDRERSKHWISAFCWKCGYEETTVEETSDSAEVVTPDEILAVHELLERTNLTVEEMTE